jgi:hypothetical protein
LDQTAFNFFTSPPQRALFGGGCKVFEISQPFFGLRTEIVFGESIELAEIFDRQFGRFWPIYGYLKFKKSGIFSIFGQIWQLFFSKIDFGQNWS